MAIASIPYTTLVGHSPLLLHGVLPVESDTPTDSSPLCVCWGWGTRFSRQTLKFGAGVGDTGAKK